MPRPARAGCIENGNDLVSHKTPIVRDKMFDVDVMTTVDILQGAAVGILMLCIIYYLLEK